MRSVRVGLISDTHGLLREEARRAMQGADYIVHAGDICAPQILDELAAIAPLTAVCGNNDFGPWAGRLPETARLRVGTIEILAIHDLAELAIDPLAEGIRIVVSGHSHRPLIQERDGVLYVNPGSAGPRRFRLPISVGHLSIRGSEVEARLHELTIP